MENKVGGFRDLFVCVPGLGSYLSLIFRLKNCHFWQILVDYAKWQQGQIDVQIAPFLKYINH